MDWPCNLVSDFCFWINHSSDTIEGLKMELIIIKTVIKTLRNRVNWEWKIFWLNFVLVSLGVKAGSENYYFYKRFCLFRDTKIFLKLFIHVFFCAAYLKERKKSFPEFVQFNKYFYQVFTFINNIITSC